MKKNIFKAIIIIGLMASMTGCGNSESSMEDLKVHTQEVGVEIGANQIQEQDDTMIPVLSMIEFNGKGYDTTNIEDVDMLLNDLDIDPAVYEDNVALKVEDGVVKDLVIGDVGRFKGLTFMDGLVSVEDSIEQLRDLEGVVSDYDDAVVIRCGNQEVLFNYKNGEMEFVLIEQSSL